MAALAVCKLGCGKTFHNESNRSKHERKACQLRPDAAAAAPVHLAERRTFATFLECDRFLDEQPPLVVHGAAKLSAAAVPLTDGEDKADLSCWHVAADPPAGIKWAARVYYMCSRAEPQTAKQKEATGRLVGLTSGAASHTHGLAASFKDDDVRRNEGKHGNSRFNVRKDIGCSSLVLTYPPFQGQDVKPSVRMDCPVRITVTLLVDVTWEVTQRHVHSAACVALPLAPRDKTHPDVLAWVQLAHEHGMSDIDIWQALWNPDACLADKP